MISRMFEESILLRFFKNLLHIAKHSYLFHFNFEIEIQEKEKKKLKPLGLFESLMVLLSRGFSQLAKWMAEIFDGSMILRYKKRMLLELQKESIGSVLYFVLGFLAVYVFRANNTKIFILYSAIGTSIIWILPLIRKYYQGSLIARAIDTFLTGGDKR